ncbi:MAG: histidine phosphatase family protein [Candidatus Dormibacteraeota bacterium]|nr:histidine phosphatase family protein [Candidatus Dormibacteraeota bacterium]
MSSAQRTRVYLARHCDVRNPQGVLYGHLPDFPLSEKGVVQAHAMGAYLASSTARTIFASPLERAQQTAQIIAEHIPGAEIITTDDLVEARFGLYLQGVRPKEVPRKRPLWLVHMVRPGLLSNDETVSAMAARVQRPIDRILESTPVDGGICVSHGDPIQAFWVRADGRRDWALHRLQCAKGGMLELDYADHRLVRTHYRPPKSTGAPVSTAPAEAGGHS